MRLPVSDRSGTKQRPADHIGEVIEASTTSYLAQCFEPDELTFPSMPALGSWVKSRDEETQNVIYGVVYHARIAPVDTIHRARALGLTAAELREEQPQIFAMLKTDFQVAIVGFEPADGVAESLEAGSLSNGSLTIGSVTIESVSSRQSQGYSGSDPHDLQAGNCQDVAPPRRFLQYLPPRPPQIHQGVYRCTSADIIAFCQYPEFLRTLLQVTGIPTDELLAAVIRGCYRLLNNDRAWLTQVGRHLSLLLKDDYDRLGAIVRKLTI